MAALDHYRTRPELRGKPRRQFRYTAQILIDGKSAPRPCKLVDVSETGARIILKQDESLPDRFLLLLSEDGGARRKCRVVWRDARVIGVAFTDGPL